MPESMPGFVFVTRKNGQLSPALVSSKIGQGQTPPCLDVIFG